MLELQDACRIIGAVLECMELHCTEYELRENIDRRYTGGGATHRRRLRLPCCPYPPQHQHPPAPAVTHRHPPTPAHQNLPCTALRCTKPDTLRRHRAVGRHWPKTRTSGKKMPLKKPRCNKPTSFHSVSRPLLPSAVVPCQGLRA